MTTRIPTPQIKWLVGAAPSGSLLSVIFDTSTPEGTVARAELRPERGFIHPSLLEVSADIEVRGNVYAMVDGFEVRLLTVEPGTTMYVDVDELFGSDFLSGKLVLEGVTTRTTTGVRRVNLIYSAGIYEIRGA